MIPIHVARLPGDPKDRPVLLLTRESVRDLRTSITVAPITSRVRGLSSEVLVGPRNGLDHESVVSCDNVATIERSLIGPQVGALHADQELDLARALVAAFDLQV